jgi:quercetin dioxygenase-like cupin family protein
LTSDYLEFDLPAEVAQLTRELAASKAGHSARTLVKQPTLRVVLIAMRADGRIPEHETAGRISIHTIAGHIRVHAAGRVFDMPAGQLLALDRSVRHEVESLADSAFVLTIAWPEESTAAHVTDS